jgi:hypothetical protein
MRWVRDGSETRSHVPEVSETATPGRSGPGVVFPLELTAD